MTDALTGLPNRRFAIEQLDRAWSAAERRGAPLACMLIDMDNFKHINDQCGHDVGDYALRSVAALLREAFRKSDLVCRLGGDEFVAVCADTDTEAAYALAERARSSVETHRMSHAGKQTTVTIGVAARDSFMRAPADLLRAADQALLSAKRAQRNSIALAHRRQA
jgi:diguanylate cyclase (GGDEF)-like protein